MSRLPRAVSVVDPQREGFRIKEATRVRIHVVALTHTNGAPNVVDYVIPGNDDAIRSISLISRLMADAIVEGRGEEAVPEDRPLPPVIEAAEFTEEAPLTEAVEEEGLGPVEDDTRGRLADPVESAGEIAPEEDPTTSYRGAQSAERQEGTAGGPERGAVPAPQGEPTSNQEGEAAVREEEEGQ